MLKKLDAPIRFNLAKYILSSLEKFRSPSTQEEFQILVQRKRLLQELIPFVEWIEFIDKLLASGMGLSSWLDFAFDYPDSVSQDISNAVANHVKGKSGLSELIEQGQKHLDEVARLASNSTEIELAEFARQEWSSQILSLALNMVIEKRLTPAEMAEVAMMLHLPDAQTIVPYFPFLVPHLNIESLELLLNSPQTIRTDTSDEILLNLALISLSAKMVSANEFRDFKRRLFKLFIRTPSLTSSLIDSASDLRSSADLQDWVELLWSRMELLPYFDERLVMNSISKVTDDKFVAWVKELLENKPQFLTSPAVQSLRLNLLLLQIKSVDSFVSLLEVALQTGRPIVRLGAVAHLSRISSSVEDTLRALVCSNQIKGILIWS